MISVTPIYASLLALLFLVLSARVIARRGAARVSLGDGGDTDLLRRSRAHANFAEYTPIALLLLVMAELQGAPSMALHLLGILLVAGRIMHGWSLTVVNGPGRARLVGMFLTLTMIGLTAAGLLGHALI